ncbi:transcriptional regulator, TetR family [Novosphingobium sp. CF614]|nr:transcriptional regulator, TetR family [Novosphingobium sp. CF614]
MRSRKKARTRIAIQDAALDLFAQQGYEATSVDQIAQRADVSPSTFFRYFGTKADIILNDQDSQLSQLCAAVRGQPSEIRDLEAVRLALQAAWVPNVDPVRTIRTGRAVGQSPFLCGVAYNIGRRWMDAVADALFERRGDPEAREECLLIARTALGVFGGATEQWAFSEAKEDFNTLVDQGFEMLERMCH